MTPKIHYTFYCWHKAVCWLSDLINQISGLPNSKNPDHHRRCEDPSVNFVLISFVQVIKSLLSILKRPSYFKILFS